MKERKRGALLSMHKERTHETLRCMWNRQM